MAPAAPLTDRALNRATLARQGLLEPMSGAASTAVQRLASLQAQHPEWPPVALATRSATPETADLPGALERRQVVRSSLMRNTIHVVSAEDLWPMFVVCRPLRLNQWRLLLKADPIDSPLGRRMTAAHEIAVAALRERPRSSLELDRLMAAEIGPEARSHTRPAWRQPESSIVTRAAWRHFAAFLPLVHVPHDGEGYGRSRYAIASDWLGREFPPLEEETARVHVARRYLAAFGPASVNDLAAYVGPGKGGIGVWRDALTALGDEAQALDAADGRTLFDLVDAPRPNAEMAARPRLLARWDSLLLSHGAKHRQRVIADEHRDAVFSRNADVLPTMLVDGFVAGTWQLRRGDGRATIMLRPFAPLPDAVEADLHEEAERLLSLIAADASERTVEIGA